MHPGGADPDGVMMAVTACGIATGEAWTATASATRASVNCIIATSGMLMLMTMRWEEDYVPDS